MTDRKPMIDRTVTLHQDYARWFAHFHDGDEVVLRYESGECRDKSDWSGPSANDVPWLSLDEAEAFAREIIELVRFARETA